MERKREWKKRFGNIRYGWVFLDPIALQFTFNSTKSLGFFFVVVVNLKTTIYTISWHFSVKFCFFLYSLLSLSICILYMLKLFALPLTTHTNWVHGILEEMCAVPIIRFVCKVQMDIDYSRCVLITPPTERTIIQKTQPADARDCRQR